MYIFVVTFFLFIVTLLYIVFLMPLFFDAVLYRFCVFVYVCAWVCVCVCIHTGCSFWFVSLSEPLGYISSLFLCTVFIAVVVLGGEMYAYAFVLDSWNVNDINGILNDTSCVILWLILLG